MSITAVDLGTPAAYTVRVTRPATTHPADAVPVLLAAANQTIGHKNRSSYQVAAKLLVEAGTLFARLDQQNDFRSHLAALRQTHRAKRALRDELDRARLP
jgi:hypothetical protein